MNILGTGLSGMIGSRVVGLLSNEWSFENLSLETGVDITQQSTVDEYVDRSNAPWVFLFAAYTDVDGAEKDKDKKYESIVWKVNVQSTEHFVQACKRRNKRILYISTDYVFDGIKDVYSENDTPHPLGWYAVTKYEGEKRVQALADHSLIIRIANPYRANPTPKMDFVHKIIAKLNSGEPLTAPSDQIFIPTLIDDIANAIRVLVTSNAHGVYHVVGSQAISPFDAAAEIARVYGLNKNTITATTYNDFFSHRAPRPLRANLKNDKISKLGISMNTFTDGLKVIFVQESHMTPNKTL